MTKPRQPARRTTRRAMGRSESVVSAPAARTSGRWGSPYDDSSLRIALVWLVSIRVAVALLWVSGDGFDSFQPPKALATRVIDVAIGLCLVLLLYRFGGRILSRTRLHILTVAYTALVLAATIAAVDPYVAVHGEIVTLEGFTYVVEMIVLYFAVSIAFRFLHDWLVLGSVAAAAILFVMGYAAMQALGLDPIPWAGDIRGRTIATLGNAEVLSVALGTALGAAVGVVAVVTNKRVAIAAGGLVVGLVLAGGTTGTRGFLLSLLAAAFVGLATWITVRRTRLANVMVAGLAVAALASVLILFTPVGSRALATFAGAEPTQDRILLYRQAFDAFANRPILGWGPGNFEVAGVAHRSVDLMRVFGPFFYYTSAHNFFVEAFVDSGVLGGAVLVALVVAFSWRLASPGLRLNPVVAAPLLGGLGGYGAQAVLSVGSVAVDWFPWLAFGGAIAITEPSPPILLERRLDRRVPVAAGAVVLIAAIVSWPAYAANDYAGRASRAAAAHQNPVAMDAARRAVDLDPGRSRYWSRLGQAFAAAGRNREAADAFAHAAERAPYHAEFWNNLAVSRALQADAGDNPAGGLQAALDAAEQGLRNDPQFSPLLYTKAFIFERMGDHNQAVSLVAQAIVIYPRDDQYDALLLISANKATPEYAVSATNVALGGKTSATLELAAAQAAARAGDRDSAISHLRRVLEIDPTNGQARDLLSRL